MTKAKRRYLLALVDGRICETCGHGIVSPAMFVWVSDCGPCRLRHIDRSVTA